MLSYHRVLLICLITFTSTALAQQNIRVFLIGGQSNAVGAAILPQDDPLWTNTLTNGGIAGNNVLFHSTARTDGASGFMRLGPRYESEPYNNYYFGPELTFGRDIQNYYPNDRIVVINGAVDGSSLYGGWKANGILGIVGDGSAYQTFQNTVNQGIAWIYQTFPDATLSIETLLWAQGETDTFDAAAFSNYQSNLENLFTDIRNTYMMHDKPFFISGMNHEQTYLKYAGGGLWKGLDAVVAAQQATAANDPNVYFVSVDGLTTGQVTWDGAIDTIHWDNPSQKRLGERFANAYLDTVPEPTTIGLLALGGCVGLLRKRLC